MVCSFRFEHDTGDTISLSILVVVLGLILAIPVFGNDSRVHKDGHDHRKQLETENEMDYEEIEIDSKVF